MSIEYWMDVPDYEGYYKVSNLGRVKSVERQIIRKNNDIPIVVREKILKQQLVRNYYSVGLSKNGVVRRFLVHRIQMLAFVPNPDNLPCVNHKDENTKRNFIWINPDGSVDLEKSNLEWCTQAYNNRYGTHPQRTALSQINRKDLIKPIKQFSKDGVFIKEWISAKDAQRNLGIPQSNISECCRKIRKTAGGYIWSFSA